MILSSYYWTSGVIWILLWCCHLSYSACPIIPSSHLQIDLPQNTPIGYVLLNVISNETLEIIHNFPQVDQNFIILDNISPTDNYMLKLNKSVENITMPITFELSCRSSNPIKYAVRITLIEVNQFEPVFKLQQTTFNISEAFELNTTILSLDGTASDPDGVYGIGYSLEDGKGHFWLNPENDLVVITKLDYDTENQHTYILKVIAAERSGNDVSKNGSATLTIYTEDVDDLSPTFTTNIYRLNISERVYDEAMNTTPPIVAYDLDRSINQPIEYEITSGNDAGIFNITPNGEIVIRGKLDRNIQPSLAFTIRASQTDRPLDRYADATVLVTIQDANDHRPVMSNDSYSVEVEENIHSGTIILVVSATDMDSGTNSLFQFQLKDTDIFKVSTLDTTGSIKLDRSKILDRETKSQHKFFVYAEEFLTVNPKQSNKSEVTVTVLDVNDNRPVFYPSGSRYFKVNKTARIGDLVGQVYANDSDEGENAKVKYSLFQTHDLFIIDPSQGSITVKAPLTEYTGIFHIQVLAEDSPKNVEERRQTILQAVVNITDIDTAPPNITNTNVTVEILENIEIGSLVYKVEAYDVDEIDDTNLRYNLFSSDQKFTIDQSGVIQTNGSLDRETKSGYNLTVVVMDTRKKVASGFVYVKLVDVNDNNPVFSKSVIEMNVTEGSSQAPINSSDNPIKYLVKDADTGDNALLTFSLLTAQGVSIPLAINSSTGEISTTGVLDREDREVYDLYVMATDSGDEPRSANAEVKITVLDINDHAPTFTQKNISLSFPEESYPGCFYEAKADDLDIGINKEIHYTTSRPTTDSQLIQVMNNGSVCIKNNQSLPLGTFSAIVVAYNNVPYVCTSNQCDNGTMSILIDVTDVNNKKPIFDVMYYNFSLDEGLTHNNQMKVHAVDNDTTAIYQDVLYSIVDNTNDFYIDSVTGLVQFQTPPDYDPPNNNTLFHLIVGARDTGRTEVETTVNVTIHINDINDNTPMFKNEYLCSILEDKPINSEFGCQVQATDIDSSNNGAIEYSVIEPVPFSVDKNSGEIKVNGSLDYELGPRQYAITVQAIDKGIPAKTGSTSVVIRINNTNDNVPEFLDMPYNFSLLEIQRVGSLVGVISAIDKDLDSITYSLHTYNSVFTISSRGSISTTAVTDLDEQNPISNYNLQVNISDGIHTNSTNVMVTIKPVNEYTPIFAGTFSGNVLENATVGTQVVQVSAQDQDWGEDGHITYSIKSGNTGDKFYINSTTGDISLNCNNCLDYNRKLVYELLIQASDNGDDKRVNFTSVNINITDVNDKPPLFVPDFYQTTLLENKPIGHRVIKVVATDLDTTEDNLIYKLLNHDDLFAMNRSDIIVNQTIDGDELPSTTLFLNVTVSDGQMSDMAIIQIDILDQNEHAPTIVVDRTNISIFENITVNDMVLDVNATDDDFSNDGFTYWLTNGDDKFYINVTSGILKVANRFDRSLKDVFNIKVHVSDHGVPPRFAERELRVNILDSNTAPVFINNSYRFDVSEGVEIGYVVGEVRAVDSDYGSSGVVRYAITSGNIQSTFSINSTNGFIRTVKNLDHETLNSFNLTIQARDLSSISKSTEVEAIVTIKDELEAPRWPTSQPVIYVHKSRDCEASQVTAISADAISSDTRASVVYTLMNFLDSFTVNNLTGTLKENPNINRGNYTIIIQACNSLDLTLCSNTSLTVTVTEKNTLSFCPVFITKYIPEDFPVNETIVILNTTSDTNQFKITNIDGDRSFFSLDAHTGELKLAKNLDRETTDNYRLLVQAFNQSSTQTATGQVILRITDVPDSSPYFTQPVYRGEISEAAVISDPVMLNGHPLVLTAVDEDLNPQLNYTIVTGSGEFDINRTTGAITLVAELDRENTSSYTFTVEVNDGYFTSNTTVEITVTDVNDVDPVFDLAVYNISVFENATINSVLLTVNAKDKDAVDDGKIRYTLKDNALNFDINQVSGAIQIVQVLDRENSSQFDLSVVAVDSAGHNTTSQVIIEVLDINDNPPVFTKDIYEYSIQEGPNSLNKSFDITATDRDINENSRLNFKISSNIDGSFKIKTVGNKGILTSIKELDREKTGLLHVNGSAVYSLDVLVEDSGSPVLTGRCRVDIFVNDINDNGPVFNITANGYTGTVAEDSLSGTPVKLSPSLIVNDADYGINGEDGLEYILFPVTAPFKVDHKTGEIQVFLTNGSTLDRETKSFYKLQLVVEDSGGLNSSTNIFVTILDKNDEAPQFAQSEYTFDVQEDAEPSTSVGIVSAFDTDNDGNSSVRYKLETNGEGRFFIDGLSGELKLAGGLDREEKYVYHLIVIAEDQSDFSGTATIHIDIRDANDNRPMFSQPYYNFALVENTVNITIGSVNATDLDIGVNQNINYFINDTDKFAIDEFGNLTVLQMFDRENISSYKFTVFAEDQGNPAQLSSVQISVSITDVNDNSPVFCGEDGCQIQNYRASIVNKLPPNSFVWLAVAKDIDYHSNVTFDLQGKTAELFQIGSTSGIITTKGFDIDDLVNRGFIYSNQSQNASIKIEILARDGGGRNTSVPLDLSIEIIDTTVPMFNYTVYNFSIMENKPVDTDVGQVEATIAMNNVVFTYSIVSSTEEDSKVFSVDSNTGQIKTKQSLDRESLDRYLFVVQVKDGRTPEHTAYTQVHITVEDDNDNSPKFEERVYTVSVKENEDNITVLTLTATDDDHGVNKQISYSIIKGNNDSKFTIDRDSGEIKLMNSLDREKETLRMLTVQASDGGTPNKTSSVNVSVKVEDINDNIPIIVNTETTIHVKESNIQVRQIIQVNATDPDDGLNGEVLYAITSGDQNLFQINAINGWLSTMRALLKQTNSVYPLTVMAYNLGTPRLNSTKDITVRVVSSSTPKFLQDVYSVDLFVGMKTGTIINVNLTAGPGEYFYQILSGNYSDLFHINDTNGELALAKDLQELTTYRLLIQAAELADNANIDKATVVVSVRQPEVKYERTEYTAYIEENLSPGVLVIDLNITDELGGLDLNYILDGGDGMFSIANRNGCIYTNESFDRESKDEYTLVVRVTSRSQSQRTKREVNSDTTRVVIHIDDINDNPPIFTYTGSVMIVSVPQSASTGFTLTTLQAVDPDVSGSGSTIYQVSDGDKDIFDVDVNTGEVKSLVDMTSIDRDQFNIIVTAIDTNSTLYSELKIKIYVVPDDNRYILTGNITLPALVAFKDALLSNLSNILNMTIELDSVQPHASIVNGKKVISSDRSDVFIRAYYKPDNKKLVPWKEIQQKVSRERKAINELFEAGSTYTTDPPATRTNSEGQTLGIAEMTLLGLASAIFLGSLIAIVVVIRSWKIQAAKQDKMQMAMKAREKISCDDANFSDTFGDSDSAVMELDADVDDDSHVFSPDKYVRSKRETETQNELKKMVTIREVNEMFTFEMEKGENGSIKSNGIKPQILTLEEQERTLDFGNETSDMDTIALRDIILGRTAMDLEREILSKIIEPDEIVVSTKDPLSGIETRSTSETGNSNSDNQNVSHDMEMSELSVVETPSSIDDAGSSSSQHSEINSNVEIDGKSKSVSFQIPETNSVSGITNLGYDGSDDQTNLIVSESDEDTLL